MLILCAIPGLVLAVLFGSLAGFEVLVADGSSLFFWMSLDIERAGESSLSTSAAADLAAPCLPLPFLWPLRAPFLWDRLVDVAAPGGVPGVACCGAGGVSAIVAGSTLSLGSALVAAVGVASSGGSGSATFVSYRDFTTCAVGLPERRLSARSLRLSAASCLWRSLSAFSDFAR